jgi:hypothetical protein
MSNSSTATEDRAKAQARLQFEAIAEMVKRLHHAKGECGYDTGACQEGADGGDTWKDAAEYHDWEKAREAIDEDPLSIEVRTGWFNPCQEAQGELAEYHILLCWGGPAVRIIGELGRGSTPETARLEYQDWFTPWEAYPLSPDQEEILLDYARDFYYGE